MWTACVLSILVDSSDLYYLAVPVNVACPDSPQSSLWASVFMVMVKFVYESASPGGSFITI